MPPRIIEQGLVAAGEPGTERQSCAFPGVCVLPGGRWLCAFRGAPTKGATRSAVYLCRSDDEGRTWSPPTAPFDPPRVDGKPGIFRTMYLTALGGTDVLAALCWVDHTDPALPFFNETTEGLLPTKVFLAYSADAGESWSEPRLVDTRPYAMPTPLTGPVLLLPDGTWALQFELNKEYRDTSPWRHAPVLMYSADGGRTWPRHAAPARDPANRLFYWDQRPGALPGGGILDVFWTFDTATAGYLPIHACESHDLGATWTAPWNTGVPGQPAPPVGLPGGSILMVYVDRTGNPTIKARCSRDGGRSWPEESELVIFGGSAPQTADKRTMQDAWSEMGKFSIGLPATAPLADGGVLVVWYAGPFTDLTDIRWARIAAF